ncbi:MAG TPA: hypothetical protein VFW44_16365 [Bryobacteraceae bacterium]|nr:hypothetical protein [Bryobacteraceae bacterium]
MPVYTKLVRKTLTLTFTAVLLAAGVGLCIYATQASPSPHGLMNAEGVVALGLVALLFCRANSSVAATNQPIAGFEFAGLAIMAVAIALAFAPILRTPFLYDDYTHITDASHYTLRIAAQQFEPVHGRGLFFRPVGFFFYWLTYLWAGANAVWWHASSIALHAICACLVYLLCREVGIGRAASLCATLLFAFSGVVAEPVAWIDARFDLMTTAMLLIGILCVCRFAAGSTRLWLVLGLAVGAAGALYKESGFCMPLLILSLALFRPRSEWPRIWRAAAWAGGVAAVLFAYRWWALGGIGGYGAPAGDASILHFNLLHSMNALLLRQWTILLFPFNWSAPASALSLAALVAIPFLLAAWAWMARPRWSALTGCVAFVIAAGLPVQHLLLIGPPLAGSRQLYLGSVGWALLWACVLDTIAWRPRIAIAAALLAIEICLLEHNLSVWRDTARLARSICSEFGAVAAVTPDPIVVRGLPALRMGTVFLNNGFPQCVEMNSGVRAERIGVSITPAPADAHEFLWNDERGRLEEVANR